MITITGGRENKYAVAGAGEYLTHACFEISNEYKYIRFEVVDANGKKAYTRAYFKDEI